MLEVRLVLRPLRPHDAHHDGEVDVGVGEDDQEEPLRQPGAEQHPEGQCHDDSGEDERDGRQCLREGAPGKAVSTHDVGHGQADRQGEDGAREGLHDGEDGRYAALRREWGADAPARFFRLYVAQAVAATLCSVPGLAAMRGGPLDAWAFGLEPLMRRSHPH